MTLPAVRTATLLATVLCTLAHAQTMEFGLDLTDDPNAVRPRLAVLPLPDDAPAAAQSAIAQFVERAEATGRFARVIGPEESAGALGEQRDAALSCGDPACLEVVADILEVDRVVTPSLPTAGELTFQIYERSLQQVRKDSVPFAPRELASWMDAHLERLGAPMAVLTVTSNPDGAGVALDDAQIGQTPFERQVPPGTYQLKVSHPNHLPFTQQLTLAPNATESVDAQLEFDPAAVVQGSDPDLASESGGVAKSVSGPSIFSRPGLYVAAAGVVMLTTGAILGANAQSTADRAVDANGDGVLDVTRAQIEAARQNAVWANVLMGTGAAATAGGAVWFLLTPSTAPAPGGGTAVGVSLAAGGVFP